MAAGFQTEEATTGKEALQAALARPDLILLDVNLPDINGFEVCRRLKSNPATAQIPVIQFSKGANTSMSAPEGERPTTFRVLHDGQEIPTDRLPMQMAARSGLAVRNYEFCAAFEDGSSRDFVGDAVPLLDENGNSRAHLTRQTLGFYRESTAPREFLVSEVADSAIDLLKK